MAKHIPVPPDLEHLIEKRESNDRRKQNQPSELEPPAGDGSTASKPPGNIPERRRKQRRKKDS